jgi:drug/metabolite transporter (DMT)-like permease
VVTILALAAAVLYGTADFLGGVASRRASVFAVLAMTVPAGAVVVLAVALAGAVLGLTGPTGHGLLGDLSAVGWTAAGWAAASGVFGAGGLIAFYAGFASAPISVVAPVAALVSTVLPVSVAIAGGERPTASMVAGGLLCLVAIVLVSMPSSGPSAGLSAGPGSGAGAGRTIGVSAGPGAGPWAGRALAGTGRLRALGYGAAAGAGFGLFFLFLKDAGQSGVLWPVAISRTAGAVVALGGMLVSGTRPWRRARGGGIAVIALASGAIDAAANVCYVLATRVGLFGLAVVITSLYPGMTVLLARLLLGERTRWLQRVGLLLAALGVVLLTA